MLFGLHPGTNNHESSANYARTTRAIANDKLELYLAASSVTAFPHTKPVSQQCGLPMRWAKRWLALPLALEFTLPESRSLHIDFLAIEKPNGCSLHERRVELALVKCDSLECARLPKLCQLDHLRQTPKQR